jgi:hypothetical protein
MKNWFGSGGPRQGPGPDDGPNPEPFNRARAEAEVNAIFGNGGGKAS